MLTTVSPEAASGQIQKPIVEVFLRASLRLPLGSETWQDVAGLGLGCELTAFLNVSRAACRSSTLAKGRCSIYKT
jgi:hypothetical protein